MIIEPADVLRMQADLRDRLSTPTVQHIVNTQYADIHPGPELKGNFGWSAAVSLKRARAYRVEGQMTKALWHRAESLPDETKLGTPPVPSGFIIFEEPLILWNADNHTEIFHAIQWSPINFTLEDSGVMFDGVVVTMWNDISREPDDVYKKVVIPEIAANPRYAKTSALMGRWSLINSGPFYPEWPVGPVRTPVQGDIADRIRARGGTPVEWVPNLFRVFSALFSMLSERIPATEKRKAELTRTETKQARREGIEPEVILVTLRPEYKDPEQRGTGHPIGVKYPMGDPDDPESIAFYRTIHKGTPRERRIPVHSHWRGKPDAPVSQRKRVYNLAR